MHDGGGGSVVHDLGAVVEVVQVVTTIEAPKTKDVVQDQVLERERRTVNAGTDGQTGDRRTDSPRPAASSWTRCFSGVSRAAAPLGSLAAWRIDQRVNESVDESKRKTFIYTLKDAGGAQTRRQHELHIGGLNS